MPSLLRQVLEIFEAQKQQPLSTAQIARRLDVAPEMLEAMLQHWVRKGKIREVAHNTAACDACGELTSCPFVMNLPRHYELAGPGAAPCHDE